MKRIHSTTVRRRAGVVAARVVAATAMVLGLAACGDGKATGVTEQSTLVLRNDAPVPIQFVQFARCTDESWGPDRLGATETIAPGAIRTWNIAPGCWDLRATTSTHSGSWYDNEVSAGGSLQFALPPLEASLATDPFVAGELKR